MRAALRVPLVCLLLLSPACGGPTVDLKQALKVENVTTGWLDTGVVNGQTKLVPTMSFTLRNGSNQTLPVLQINALFRRVSEKDEWGSDFVTAAGSEGLAAGASTRRLTVKSNLGYTGSNQTRQEMLRNSLFVDAKVELSAKYGATQWVRIGDFPVARQLMLK
jgi:hypothetical protein